MNILFIGPLPEPITGHSLACQVFLDELVKQNRVEVVNLTKRSFKQGISSLSRISEVLGMVWQIWKKKSACDVIYFTISESYAGNLKDLMIYLACFKQLSRMAIHLHGGAGMRKILLGKGWFFRYLNQFFLRQIGAVIVLGQRHVDLYSGTVARERIHIVPNFAEDRLFSNTESINRKFQQVKPLRILFLSNLLPGKGHIELLDAFNALNEPAKAAVELNFAGGFEDEEQRSAFLNQIAGVPQVHYHGIVRGEKKQQLFAEAHVFCLPTYYPYEGQPISILEAYAAGCVVVTTDHSGIFDIFSDGINGYAVKKKSAQSLKLIIEKMIANPLDLHNKALTNFNAANLYYKTDYYNSKMVKVISSLEH